MSRPTFVDISPSAWLHNLEQIRKIAPNSRILAAVKANAYGHGILDLQSVLAAADSLGVCCLEEALSLRQLGIQKPIVLLEGFFAADELPLIEDHQLSIVVRHRAQWQALMEHPRLANFSIWLKINTGMNRLGFNPIEAEEILRAMSAITFKTPPILMTHFSCADEINSPQTQIQIELFQKITNRQPTKWPTSLANSAGILGWPESHREWIRPGLSLYGISPFADSIGADFNLKPVMTLRAGIIDIRQCQAGDSIGYAMKFTCDKPMRIGIVSMGYADGYPRFAPNGTPVLVNGDKARLVGRVSMDMLTVDLTHLEAQVGDVVTFWGEGLPIEIVAKTIGVGTYELICGVSSRAYRRSQVK